MEEKAMRVTFIKPAKRNMTSNKFPLSRHRGGGVLKEIFFILKIVIFKFIIKS